MIAVIGAALLAGSTPSPPTGTVSGKVKAFKAGKAMASDGAWVYLEDLGPRPERRPGQSVTEAITQKSIQFSPRVLVIPVGATIAFPNKDPIEHNVFSPFLDQRNVGFDLGRYGPNKQGKTRKFLEAGEFSIYCDVHKDMSATVKVVPTRYFARIAKDGTFSIPNVPPGRYRVNAWAEASLDVKSDPFDVTANQTIEITPLHLQIGNPPMTHLNKTGDPYGMYEK